MHQILEVVDFSSLKIKQNLLIDNNHMCVWYRIFFIINFQSLYIFIVVTEMLSKFLHKLHLKNSNMIFFLNNSFYLLSISIKYNVIADRKKIWRTLKVLKDIGKVLFFHWNFIFINLDALVYVLCCIKNFIIYLKMI
jgi:hypothetical protein